jgi:ABC-type polysaccharide/polyol phosphate export permease
VIIYVVIAFFCGVPFTTATWLVIPALLLISLNGLWVATLLGLIGTRYRDVQQLITSLLQIILFMTPIFWNPDQLPAVSRSRFLLVDLNPVFQYVEILRDPLLGKAPALVTWGKVLGMTVVGMLVTFEVYARFRRRLTYWL